MKARKIIQRSEAIYLARNNQDHFWRFVNGEAKFSYYSAPHIWKSCPQRKNRFQVLKEDGWQVIGINDIGEIVSAYKNGEKWYKFPEENEEDEIFAPNISEDEDN